MHVTGAKFSVDQRRAAVMKYHVTAVIASILLSGTGVALGGNYGFLKDSPISSFTEEDVSMMMKAADDALNDATPHAKREWQNPATGNSGQMEVLRSFELADGTSCRTLQVFNKAKAAENRATHSVCKSADGTWMIRPDAKSNR
jgi:surface antigen